MSDPSDDMTTEQQRQQWQFTLDHKTLCMERAIERCDYDAANIFSAQADYYRRQLGAKPLRFNTATEAH